MAAHWTNRFAHVELWRVVPDGLRETIPTEKCPRCLARRIRRSRTRGAWELVLRVFTPVRPFRCRACRWRGWRWPVASTADLKSIPALQPGAPGPKRRRQARPRPVSIAMLMSKRRYQIGIAAALAIIAVAVYLYNQPQTIAWGGVVW